MREFLATRLMVAYAEPWMDRVDAMKKIQGWSETSEYAGAMREPITAWRSQAWGAGGS